MPIIRLNINGIIICATCVMLLQSVLCITAYEINVNNSIEYTWNISIYEMKFANEKEK